MLVVGHVYTRILESLWMIGDRRVLYTRSKTISERPFNVYKETTRMKLCVHTSGKSRHRTFVAVLPFSSFFSCLALVHYRLTTRVYGFSTAPRTLYNTDERLDMSSLSLFFPLNGRSTHGNETGHSSECDARCANETNVPGLPAT